jgi:hypothetical protein
MPSLLIKERRSTRLLKLPLRVPATLLGGVGHGLQALGGGITKLSGKISFGKSKEWIAKEDLDTKTGKKIHWGKQFAKETKDRESKVEKAKVEHEKQVQGALKVWQEKTKVAAGEESTLQGEGSVWNEKVEKEFC